MKNKYGRYFTLFSAGISFFFLISCSGTPPQIHEVTWKRVYYLTGKQITARCLSLFVNVSDNDGPKDISSLYIIQDTAELFWKYDSSSWSEKKIDNNRWIGSNRIQMPDNRAFPEGIYRIIVIDSGGERDTREIYLPKAASPHLLPEIVLMKDNAILIHSPYKENYLFLKNRRRGVVKVLKVVPGRIPADLVMKDVKNSSIAAFTLYSVNTVSNTGFIVSVDNKYSF